MIKMPMMMTDRSIPNIEYITESENEVVFITSSKGTEQLVESKADTIQKNIVGNNVINY